MKPISRRDILKFGGLSAAGLVLSGFQSKPGAPKDPNTVIVQVGQHYDTGTWAYEPAGVYLQKGQKIRWITTKTGAGVWAFHPSNFNHELRIPENAKPFASGLLSDFESNTFEYTFEVEGTYDYFSRMQEPVGMVGRIIVGTPGGPAEKNPPGYGGKEGRAVVYPAEIAVFNVLSSKDIMAKKILEVPKNINARAFPYGDI